MYSTKTSGRLAFSALPPPFVVRGRIFFKKSPTVVRRSGLREESQITWLLHHFNNVMAVKR